MKCVFVAFLLLCTLLQLRAIGGVELQRQEEMLPDDGGALLTSERLMKRSSGADLLAKLRSYKYAKEYNGQVIYIESYRWRGRWLDASKKKGWAYFQSVPQKDVVDHLGDKWLVKDVGDGKVVLESMKYKSYYLDADKSEWCKVTYSSYPQGQNWAKFKIDNRNGHFFFQSDRFPTYRLDAYESSSSKYWAAFVKGLGVDTQFRIYVPPKSDSYKEIDSLDNTKHDHEAVYKFEETIGISVTNAREISNTVSTEIGGEIKSAFSFGLTYSTTWKAMHSTTFSKQITRSVSTKVGPGKKLKVLQLVGTYGHYIVRANHFKFVSVDIQANTQEVVLANGIEEYNRGEIEQEPDPNAGPPGTRPGAVGD